MNAYWEHFDHGADIGVRGVGDSVAEAFEQAALALTGVLCSPEAVRPESETTVRCRAPDRELLLVDWLNELIYLMSTRGMIFGRFHVVIDGDQLEGVAAGERVDAGRHAPAVEVKGATLTALSVAKQHGRWTAQCVVDV